MRRFPALQALLPFLALLAMAPAASEEVVLPAEQVAPGVLYARYVKDRLVAHVLKVDLHQKNLQVRSIKARGTETVQRLARRLDKGDVLVLGALNGDYFHQGSSQGAPHGVHVADGRLLFPPMRRSMIAFGPRNEPTIEVVSLRARLGLGPPEVRGAEADWMELGGVNVSPDEGRGNSIYLYTPAMQNLSPYRSRGLIAVVESTTPALRVGEVCQGIIARVETGRSEVRVPEGGCLLYVAGKAARSMVEQVVAGKPVAIKIELPPLAGAVSQAIGGGPRLLRDGRRKVEMDQEDFDSFHGMELHKRHPRAAAGFDEARQTLYLVMVEGRHERSRGMSFSELAGFMADLGCYQALAFDGGGSAGMYVAGKGLVSRTEDRSISNALVITTSRSGASGTP